MLSRKAKYAIKALLLLSRNIGQVPLKTGHIASIEKIPRKYLETILNDLQKTGWIYSKKGSNGGYVLYKEPKEINLVEIIRLTDGPIAMVSCASANFYRPCEECINEATCTIKRTFLKVRDATLQVLANTTLADLLNEENELIMLETLSG